MIILRHSLSFIQHILIIKCILLSIFWVNLLTVIPHLSVPSGQVVMAVAQRPFLATVLLLVSSGLHCSSPVPACPEPCTCQSAPLLNCSSSSLSLVPQGIQDSVTDLDLSHNLLGSVTLDRPHYNLRNVWLGNNSITRLSLCIERNLGGRYDRGRHRLRPWSRRGCVSWAPTLQLLSVERNHLEQLPEGESVQYSHI